jgi:hypothetical protein
MTLNAGTLRPVLCEPAGLCLPQGEFDDLYSAVYRVLDDAKAGHDLVKLYKGSHASPLPHDRVLDTRLRLVLLPDPAWLTGLRLHGSRRDQRGSFRRL